MLKIHSYQIQQFAGGKGYHLRAIIWLYDQNNMTVGSVRFYRNADDTPAHDKKVSSGFITGYYHPEQYPEVVDLLRNEKPIYLLYSSNKELAYLSTTVEPVGEAEL
jgi:hypothetical protein